MARSRRATPASTRSSPSATRAPTAVPLPTPERFLFEFRRFRARYPWVSEFATWNEANHCGEPTCHRPELVAAYYRSSGATAATAASSPPRCSTCRTWSRGCARSAATRDQEPRYWGLHNYIDANRARTTGTRRMLHAVKGQIWFTETGGIVRRANRHKVTFPESAPHAATATRFLFRRLVPLSRRVTRVYIYHWNADAPGRHAGTPR